jgi:membrane dipeptidase
MYLDSLICSRLDRQGLQDLVDGGVRAATVTCGFWEDATESMDSLVRWQRLITENSDLAGIGTSAGEIDRISAEGRVAIVLGFQNSAFLQGRLGYVDLFHQMGVRVAQLTYNIQNDVGGSCYDPKDSGLTRFGEEVVAEMNRVGMVIDLSHVGNRTSLEAVRLSEKPVAVTHANCSDLVDHPRNKPAALLKEVAERRGMVGLTVYHNITRGYNASPDHWAGMVAKTAELIGTEHIGIGTDDNQGGDAGYLAWMRNGRWSHREQRGASIAAGSEPVQKTNWYRRPADFEVFGPALRRAGFSEEETSGILWDNWMRFYKEVLV